jgi:hypothetical protein
LYLGVFTAPALLFFAFTGALQTFSLHETTRGSSYKPPAWAVTLGQIHKKQTPVVPVRKPPVPEATAGGGRRGEGGAGARESAGPNGVSRDAARPRAEEGAGRATDQPRATPGQPVAAAASEPSAAPGKKHHPLPMKIFFLIVAISLFLSTLTGIYMSYKYVRNRRMVTVLLILGTAIPLILVFV